MKNVRAPRDIIGPTLADYAAGDERLIVLDADLGRSTRLTAFEEQYPERYIQLGVAEQNAVGMASGLIYAGFKPVFVTFTMFAIGLPWTQVRQAAYAGLPLKIIGTHPGYDIGPDGGTHQMFEDLALSRVIPEIEVLTPCDTPESIAAIQSALASPRLTYVRIGRHPVPDLHDEPVDFKIGKAEIIFERGRDYVLIADGSMVATACEVAERLRGEELQVCVVNIRTIKPLDEDLLRELCKSARLMITIENHSVFGGLGGAVAEVVSEFGGRLLRIGSRDHFGESAPTTDLLRSNALDVNGILEQIVPAIKSIQAGF